MAKLILFYFLLVLGLTILTPKTLATNYMVGDSSGWDISTDMQTWPQGKTFMVGDVLIFQYSSSNSVEEVSKPDFDSCNTANPISTYSNGNTTVPLRKPGPMYFVSGNKLYCLGGMKLQVNVESNEANSPIGSPQAQPGGTLRRPSAKTNNPVIPTSAGQSVYYGRYSIIAALLGFCGYIFMWLMLI